MTMPRIRSRAAFVLLAAVVALLLSACLTESQQSVLDELNADRREHQQRELPNHADLTKKAQAWAEKLAQDGKLSHSALASGLPACWKGVGENVGLGPSIAAVQTGYMNSEGHRKNALGSQWNFVGVGAAQRGSTWYTVQVFMTGCT